MQNLKYVLIILMAGMASCASIGIKMADSELEWASKQPQSSEIVHSIYLIGDAGASNLGQSSIPLIELQKQLSVDNRQDAKTDVVFLGDNIYPVGMPPIGHQNRQDAEHKLNVQLESIRGFQGNVTFVPGNHDWYEFGREGLQRQEQYIEQYLAQYNEDFTDYFRPSDGCGDVAVLTVADKITIVSIDSHWFLKDMPRNGGYDYSDCEIKTRAQFVSAFSDTMALLADHDVMLTMHHPLYTTGSHGGYYNLASYLMPLTAYNKQLIIPLPMSGYIVNNMRAKVSEQDAQSAPYATYRQALIPAIEEHGHTIVAAGHEHTLQYHVINDVNYIVSGSGSKTGKVESDTYTKFAYGNYGYALVDYYTCGEIWVSFYALDEDNQDFLEVYRAEVSK